MLSALVNLITTTPTVLATWGEGIGGAAALARAGFQASRQPGGIKANAAALLGDPARQRQVMAVLRAFVPNLALDRVLVQAYPNGGTVIVTRREDVLDVLARDADFEVVYEPRMRKLTDGDNFFLGMQPGWDYTRDVSAMRLAARQTDVAEIVAPQSAALAEAIVSAGAGTLDLPPRLTLEVPWAMTEAYFGVGGPDRATMQDWTTTMFWYLFGDLGADPALEAKALGHAAAMRVWLDQAIARRKATPTDTPDLLNRCLALQAAGVPGMSDLGIRNNLLGLLIGAIPTISKASCLALDEILRRPEILAHAQKVARSGDDTRLAGIVWEALRFNPHNPVIYRRATRDTVIAKSTLRETHVRKGQMVFAATLSAMFDRYDIDSPGAFRANRRFEDYIIWGQGMHTCFGAAINAAVIPAILKPLLARSNLRRADGDAGRIDTGGTPFPQHFTVLYDG